MPRFAILAVVGATIATVASQPALRAFISKWSGIRAPGGVWRILAVLLALANLKNLPGVWHIRFFRAFFYQLYLQPTPIPPHALFQPVVTSTRTPLMETDYNIHKSNSTYFSDMDVSRTHLFTAIVRNGILKNSRRYGQGRSQKGVDSAEPRHDYMIALGGISCLFKKEILPYQKFEMWTRLLTWDRKWFYLVTHLVKPGVAKPPSWTLQPWKKGEKQKKRVNGEEKQYAEETREKLKGAIFATALAKYVVKKGRITVPPEEALRNAEMVPLKPEGWEFQSSAHGFVDGDVDSVFPRVVGEKWNWDIIEAERLRGLKFAEHFAAFDGLHEVFDGGKNGALGEYADLLF
ncbi:uncharacterized protein BDR25DRAFT_342692 [Lindgomyces ingoldianus]|uniref:Uncharacterized protein n=1 Tax=Lindgomyces ingoldianus TaxID=673940 RepID=A0ACB6QWQ4_9PLEO|nr:uncharacterized protein BDR25DRAFT_342692 [Lindgomyces ingoldianus]KAF2471459.1 hypothetical protein BDR25DRAFT_342692 [Lindgomyces ingoldianus]